MISILRKASFSLSVTGLQSWTFKEQNPSLTDPISMMEKWQVTPPMTGTWLHHYNFTTTMLSPKILDRDRDCSLPSSWPCTSCNNELGICTCVWVIFDLVRI